MWFGQIFSCVWKIDWNRLRDRGWPCTSLAVLSPETYLLRRPHSPGLIAQFCDLNCCVMIAWWTPMDIVICILTSLNRYCKLQSQLLIEGGPRVLLQQSKTNDQDRYNKFLFDKNSLSCPSHQSEFIWPSQFMRNTGTIIANMESILHIKHLEPTITPLSQSPFYRVYLCGFCLSVTLRSDLMGIVFLCKGVTSSVFLCLQGLRSTESRSWRSRRSTCTSCSASSCPKAASWRWSIRNCGGKSPKDSTYHPVSPQLLSLSELSECIVRSSVTRKQRVLRLKENTYSPWFHSLKCRTRQSQRLQSRWRANRTPLCWFMVLASSYPLKEKSSLQCPVYVIVLWTSCFNSYLFFANSNKEITVHPFWDPVWKSKTFMGPKGKRLSGRNSGYQHISGVCLNQPRAGIYFDIEWNGADCSRRKTVLINSYRGLIRYQGRIRADTER